MRFGDALAEPVLTFYRLLSVLSALLAVCGLGLVRTVLAGARFGLLAVIERLAAGGRSV